MLCSSRSRLHTTKLFPQYSIFIAASLPQNTRLSSTLAADPAQHTKQPSGTVQIPTAQESSPLKRVPSWHLVRNIALSTFLTNPIIFRPGFEIMKVIANSKAAILNPDRNIILRAALKPTLYKHFCAGTNAQEIKDTITSVTNLGFRGVALISNREIQPTEKNAVGDEKACLSIIAEWRSETLKALDMIESGNWLGMKITGGGQEVAEALLKGQDMPAAFQSAIEEVCQKAREKNCRVWIDAEQQAVQASIDKLTLNLMRKFNKGPKAFVYGTVQAYLKEGRQKLQHQMRLAAQEDWTLGVKLVRGAYISYEQRGCIHDTKPETDACYDGIVHDLLSGTVDQVPQSNYPRVNLILAGHNSETVRKALLLARSLADQGKLKVFPEFAQLQGMADDLGGKIVEFGEEAAEQRSLGVTSGDQQIFIPRTYKALHWGTVQESMQYLVRRAVENSAAVGRMRETATASRRELLNRMRRRLRLE